MKLIVQNMVCDRCVESVKQAFQESEIPVHHVQLGRVETVGPVGDSQLNQISEKLSQRGFSLSRNREQEVIEQLKVQLLRFLNHLEENPNPEKLSVFISRNMHYNYSYLSHLFSESVGETIESWFIKLKIERVKELLGYGQKTLSEIAWLLNYSSVQYLSNQFKKVTGLTVTEYQKHQGPERKPLDLL